MTRYLSLINFTDQGVRDVSHSVERASQFKKSVEGAGGKLLSQYWSIGDADGCVVFEAPDEQTGAALLLALAKAGNVRTRTMRLYDTQEFQQVLGEL
ncbi:MAG: GYD domain-containing protein [Aureliella sp.]